ncbi:uncharacterized protein Dmoj_GI18006 [Drosophila mojavensis]|uniref:Uncharacterized protein n=1 Tax=Drosophila mojavensis TaxID=7230 RepID=B4KF63_DROMO|nr:uncharacterized protein Dmoj_GI18006 [Drosophila mojavensis]
MDSTPRGPSKPESASATTDGIEEGNMEDTYSTETEQPVPLPSFRTPRSMFYGCCIAKEYFMEYVNLVDSLHITPRLMIQRKPFRKNNTYGLTLTIRNSALYPRKVLITTDSPNDTSINIFQPELNTFIETDKVLEVKINIRSKTSVRINRPRCIFIKSFHPNITFEVPIIVLKNMTEPFISKQITLPPTVPKDRSYYEMIMYNPTKDPINVKYRNSFKGLTLHYMNQHVIVPHDYLKLLIKFDPRKLQEYNGFFNVKFGTSPPRNIVFSYTPKSMSAYVNRGYLPFGLTKFGDEVQRSFSICNESTHPLRISTSFYAKETVDEEESENTSAQSAISDKLIESAVSMHSVLLFDFNEDTESEVLSYKETSSIHYHIEVPHQIDPISSAQIMIKFKPIDYEEFDDNEVPPFRERTKINLCFTDSMECIETHSIVIYGEIRGIDVEIFPTVIDFRKIYLGEEHCAFIKILNVDGVVAKVKYVECLDPEICGVRVTPDQGFELEPCERGIFHLSFFTIVPARFNVVLRFKVVNGFYHNVSVKGLGQHIQLRTFPQLVEFGTIPFGVPQKRFMLLMNPLAVPITLQVKPTEDGLEQPLVFNIRESDVLPITIRDPIRQLQQVHEDLLAETDLNDNIEITDVELEQQSVKSLSINESEYSLQFEEAIMDSVPEMASQLLKNLKKQKIFDKSETDKRVIQEALTSLLNTNYFNIMKTHNNFIFLDWNAIPSYPAEVYCDNEIIYLRPNTGRSITILIVPNRVGYFHRSLTVRICPAIPLASSESSDDQQMKMLIKSEFLCSKLWFEYTCSTPDIIWESFVDLTDRIMYAGEEYNFEMEFENASNVGGFVHFDVIPNEMGFTDGNWKYYIGSNSVSIAHCFIMFRVLGINKLSGLVKIVGAPHPFPFHLYANVLPTEIHISQMSVHVRLQVFELHKHYLYIDNVSPTNTVLSMKLQNIDFQYLTTRGGKLSPDGQSMYTTLVSMFTDPDLYHNTLYIDLQFDNIIEIPITFLVEGVPIYFDPDIRDGLDAGVLFTDTQEHFQAMIYPYHYSVKLTNKGFRSYRLNVTRLTTYNPAKKTSACVNQPLTARFDIYPKVVELHPRADDFIDIMMTSYEEGVYFCDFMLVVTDLKYPQRKHVIRLTVQAQFIEGQLTWDRKCLNFEFQPSYPLRQRPQTRTALLCSQASIPFDEVFLEAVGPFRIKELYEYPFEKQIKVSFDRFEQKEIYVTLNNSTVRQMFCKLVEGRINVFAVSKPQKHLSLRLSVLVPEIHIIQPELVLFDRGRPYNYNVNIINDGCTTADYKWKRIEESNIFIGGDDSGDVVAEVLSDIIRTLEYNFSCAEEENMTIRYQKCRCQFHSEKENDSLIFDILEEILNELDLSHSRIHIPLDMMPEVYDDSEAFSDSSYVHHTIEYILDQLNLESSQRLSEPSSEYCYSDRFIYFYEKTGHLRKMESKACMIHLPHVRRSHEVKAVFQLDVVGGRSQYLSVILVNLVQKIKYLKDNIYLNVRPWYEQFNAVIRISNVTKYPLQLNLMSPEINERRLIDGYAKIAQDEEMFMEPLGHNKVKISGILGFNENFLRIFNVLINNTASSCFRLRGQGIMPILNLTTSLPMIEQSVDDIIEEYVYMRKIYNYEIFKSITEVDKDAMGWFEEEAEQESKITSDFTELSESEDDMPSERQRYHDIQLFKMVQTYVLVNNNQELPNAVVLNQMLVTERYLHRLSMNLDTFVLHQKVYESYVNHHKPQGPRLPITARHFTVQPLPCEQLAYILDLGPLMRDSLRRFELRLHFFGPGKLIASARTAVRIPGLFVDFNIENHTDKKFTFWAEKCTELEYFNKTYRNIWERLMDADTNPKLKHAHSFDFDNFIHQRDITERDRHLIEEYYNSLNLSVYPDHKHHFTLARVHTTHHSNFSGIEMRMVGYFKPESKHYPLDQRIEDYIYIDLHMGPTMPILLRGIIKA